MPYQSIGQLNTQVAPSLKYVASAPPVQVAVPKPVVTVAPKPSGLGRILSSIGHLGKSVGAGTVKVAKTGVTDVHNAAVDTEQHLNPFSGVHQANNVIAQTQQNYGLTPQFVRILHNANTSTTNKPLANGTATGLTYLPGKVPTQVNRSVVSTAPFSPGLKGNNITDTIVHEGLHQVWAQQPQTHSSFATAYNQSVTPQLEKYLQQSLSVSPSVNLANFNKLPPALQDEVHSAAVHFYTSVPNQTAPKNALTSYYNQFLNVQQANKSNNTPNLPKGVNPSSLQEYGDNKGNVWLEDSKGNQYSIGPQVNPNKKEGLAAALTNVGKFGKGVAVGTVKTAEAFPKSVYDIGRGAVGSVTGNKQAVINANKAKSKDEPTALSPFTRPLVNLGTSITHPFGSETIQPKGSTAQKIFGSTPIQNIQVGVKSNYKATHNPLEAGAYGISQAAIDLLTAKGIHSAATGDGLVGAGKNVVGKVKAVAGKDTGVNQLVNTAKANNLVEAVQKARSQAITRPSAFDKVVTPEDTDLASKTAQTGSKSLTDTLAKTKEATNNPKVPLIKPLNNETGSVTVPNVAKNVQSMIEKHSATQNATGNIEEDFAKTSGTTKDIKLDVAKSLKERTPLSNTDKQTIQDYRDAKSAGLETPELPTRLKTANDNITALNRSAQAADAEKARLSGQPELAAKIEARNPETYTHRIAQGKGSNLELTARGDRENPLSINSLSKTTAGSKKRTLLNATDEAGNRRTVSIEGNKVKALSENGKTSEDLGNLNLKKNGDFLENELKPYQNRLGKISQQVKELQNVKTKGGISQARIDALAQKGASLQFLKDEGNKLTPAERRTLHDATLKFKELQRVKPTSTNSTTRLETLARHSSDLLNKVNAITDKYDPEHLEDKAFVGKDGQKYTLGQATQSEITKNTGQKYYVDPELTSHLNYADSKVALKNTQFIEGTKKILEDKNLAVKQGEGTPPKGFKTTTNAYFQGYKLDPKLAEVLDDIGGKNTSVAGGIANKISNVLRQTIVYLPIKHDFNEAAGYIIDRGLSKIINPVAGVRGAKSLAVAAKEVATQGPLYRQILREGGHLVSADDSVLGKTVAKQVNGLAKDPNRIAELAKAIGTSPARAYHAVQKVTVWDVQDVLNIARVHERMQPTLFSKGMSFENALKETARKNLQYKVPSRIILPGKAGRAAAETLGSDKVYFGAYTYDKYRIAKNIVKDTLNVTHPKQALQAADQLAATVAIAASLWPLVNKGVQNISGDKNAHVTAPGVSSIPELAQQVIQGKKTITSAAGSQISISQPYTIGAQLLGNKDSFTGKNIWDPNDNETQKAKSIASWLKSQVAPVQKLATSKNAKTNVGLSTALGLAGVSLPKDSPDEVKLNSLEYDTLPAVQSEAKSEGSKGNLAAAMNTISQYNQKVLSAAKADLKSSGKPIPPDQTLITQLKKSGYYYMPKETTIKGWSQPKKATVGAFAP